MKKFLLSLLVLCCGTVFAETITINWLNEDKTINQTTSCTIGGDVVLPNNIPQKRGYTFKGYVDNYTPVEYIESTGSQWIDTGYKPINNKMRIKTKISVISYGNVGYFGACFSYYSDAFISGLAVCYGSAGCHQIGASVNVGDLLEIDLNKGVISVYVNNVQYNHSIINTGSPNEFLAIFWARGCNYQVASMKLYYFQIYDNDVLIRDFIPVVDSSGVACLYDRVEHKFYYNAGSGEFIAGPEIQ